MLPKSRQFRADVLASLGAADSVLAELLAFGDRAGVQEGPIPSFHLPLPPESFVDAWRAYAAESADRGAWEVLRGRLPQLQFPVREGISQTEDYRAATLQGALSGSPSGAGLALRCPETLRLHVHESLAGPIPVLCTADRADFVLLVQALSRRNEPVAVPDSMGACIISGFNNMDRVRRHRDKWLAGNPRSTGPGAWADEFRRIVPQKELYQDRFLLLAEGPYSNVPAGEMGLPPEEWLRLSHTIRLAHECTHYLTIRLFSSMRSHPLDELVADYVGVATGCGRYRPDWFLRFMGLEDFPKYRAGGRLENYRGKPPISDAAFAVVQRLVRSAAENLGRLDARRFSDARAGDDRLLLAPLYQASLEELASDVEAFLQ